MTRVGLHIILALTAVLIWPWSFDAQTQSQTPSFDVLIKGGTVYDGTGGAPRQADIAIRGDRIIRVGPDADVKQSPGAEVIDAHGRFLMPGLWDNHQHFSDIDGPLDLANGVTSARDMANDTDTFLQRVARFDTGTELGPRVLKAGIIDGTGEFAGPTKMRVDTVEQATRDVDWYADHGYAQIKIYSSVKPEFVPIITDRAHQRGLRVSGHVPAFMSARQFVEAGGLMSYGIDVSDLGHRVADVVDQILKGAKPADIPIFQPTKFELSINLKAAKTLGIELPPLLVARADNVIE